MSALSTPGANNIKIQILHFLHICVAIFCVNVQNEYLYLFPKIKYLFNFLVCEVRVVYMSQSLLLGKFEYGGGPNFKVVLEC